MTDSKFVYGEEDLATNGFGYGRDNKFVYGLVLFISAVAMLCLFLMLWLIITAPKYAAKSATVSASSSKTTTTTKNGSAIDVVRVNDWITENGAYNDTSAKSGADVLYSGNGKVVRTTGSQTTTTKSVEEEVVAPVPTPDPEPAPAVVPAPSKPAEPTYVDEDVAKKDWRADGYVVHSVYVFDSGALAGTSAKPKAGSVLSEPVFEGRSKGEKLVFLNVATALPYSNSKSTPDLKSKSWKSARTQLTNMGLGIKFEYEQDSPDTYGTVVFQSPAAGAPIPKGCSVYVVLAD